MALGAGVASPSYIGGSFAVDQTGASPTLSVPAGSIPGDTIIAVLRCRADRSMSGFTGWTTHLSTVVQSGNTPDATSSRVYILSRTLAAETSFGFTQSSASAYGFALLSFRNGVVGANSYADGQNATVTKASASSLLLAIAFANNANVLSAAPVFIGYTNRGTSSFFNTSYFYLVFAETLAGVGAGSTTATGTFSTVSAQDGVWLAEIG